MRLLWTRIKTDRSHLIAVLLHSPLLSVLEAVHMCSMCVLINFDMYKSTCYIGEDNGMPVCPMPTRPWPAAFVTGCSPSIYYQVAPSAGAYPGFS
jgi:hypothetical protein